MTTDGPYCHIFTDSCGTDWSKHLGIYKLLHPRTDRIQAHRPSQSHLLLFSSLGGPDAKDEVHGCPKFFLMFHWCPFVHMGEK